MLANEVFNYFSWSMTNQFGDKIFQKLQYAVYIISYIKEQNRFSSTKMLFM